MRLFPRNFDFFKLFGAQAQELINTAKLLKKLEKTNDAKKQTRAMKKIEHTADEITHNIIKNLNQTFITPIDREDITLLASHLDDIFDEMDRAINRLYIYKISPIPPAVFQYCRLIEKSLLEVAKGIRELPNSKNRPQILHYCEVINEIENKMDDLHRKTLGELFSKKKSPILIMKLREIYEALENVTDRCEDVANNLETIIIKNF